MRYSDLKNILKNHSLRITDCRLDVLSFFINHNKALSIKDLEDNFDKYDRVTLYRTLNSFNDKGVLHKIPDDSGLATYGLCHTTCTAEEHHHNHIHFKCQQCGQLECIEEEINVPAVALPVNYKLSGVDVIVNGTCDKCNG